MESYAVPQLNRLPRHGHDPTDPQILFPHGLIRPNMTPRLGCASVFPAAHTPCESLGAGSESGPPCHAPVAALRSQQPPEFSRLTDQNMPARVTSLNRKTHHLVCPVLAATPPARHRPDTALPCTRPGSALRKLPPASLRWCESLLDTLLLPRRSFLAPPVSGRGRTELSIPTPDRAAAFANYLQP